MNKNINLASEIWKLADQLRGSWKQHEYQDVILPLLLLKRLDSVLKPTKKKVLAKANKLKNTKTILPIIKNITKVNFYNTSRHDFKSLLDDDKNILSNFKNYLKGYSDNVIEIFDKFKFHEQLKRLAGGKLLYIIIKEINAIDIHPDKVDNHSMGLIFEELLRKFSEMSNETAGEHYTPRDVVSLCTEALLFQDLDKIKRKGTILSIYDPACGTGGMLHLSREYILSHNINATIYLNGQELNPATYALAKSEMLIQGIDDSGIKGGDNDHSQASTLSNDQHPDLHFNYALSNPPYGNNWQKDKQAVDQEANKGYGGRFGAGLPRISDGQLLFLQHLLSKTKSAATDKNYHPRIGIVMSGSPLFAGGAGSGESNIRRWILEKDYLETIIALPGQLFYNTGIGTYLWFLTTKKTKQRQNKVQLIDARTFSTKMKKSLNNKRNEIDNKSKEQILTIYQSFKNSKHSKIFNTTDFGFRKVTIERPLRLTFNCTKDKIETLKQELNKRHSNLIPILTKLANKTYKTITDFNQELQTLAKINNTKLTQAQTKLITQTLSSRSDTAPIITDKHNQPLPDPELRDHEHIPLNQDIQEYFNQEVKPHLPDAYINHDIKDQQDNQTGIVGYEIPFTKYFYKFTPLRPLQDIEKELDSLDKEIQQLQKQLKK